MLHISLFSGIGGFDLASEWMGWKNIASCEINPFGRKVLEYYWPEAYHYDDIHTFTYNKLDEELTKRFGAGWRSDDIILTGGFPCQPYSAAGKRLGKEDDRHLWPEMLRAIREIKPRWIVGENVHGIVNWSGGLVFEEVQADLEAEGYEVQAFILPACGVNAPHRRDRVWFVAYSDFCNDRRNTREDESEGYKKQIQERDTIWKPIEPSKIFRTSKNPNENGWGGDEWKEESCEREQRDTCTGDNERLSTDNDEIGTTADTTSKGREERQHEIGWKDAEKNSTGMDNRFKRYGSIQASADTELKGLQGQYREWKRCTKHRKDSGVLSGSEDKFISSDTNGRRFTCKEHRQTKSEWFAKNGISANWENFPTQSPICDGNDGIPARLDSITFPKWRNESIKAGGNAIVPQVVYQIFKSIQDFEDQLK